VLHELREVLKRLFTSVYQAIHEVTEARMRDVRVSLLASREIRGLAMGAHLMRIYDRHWRPIEPEGGVRGRHRHAPPKPAKIVNNSQLPSNSPWDTAEDTKGLDP
jgi:hypothetical protein